MELQPSTLIKRFSDREIIEANRAYYHATALTYNQLNGLRKRTRDWLKEITAFLAQDRGDRISHEAPANPERRSYGDDSGLVLRSKGNGQV